MKKLFKEMSLSEGSSLKWGKARDLKREDFTQTGWEEHIYSSCIQVSCELVLAESIVDELLKFDKGAPYYQGFIKHLFGVCDENAVHGKIKLYVGIKSSSEEDNRLKRFRNEENKAEFCKEVIDRLNALRDEAIEKRLAEFNESFQRELERRRNEYMEGFCRSYAVIEDSGFMQAYVMPEEMKADMEKYDSEIDKLYNQIDALIEKKKAIKKKTMVNTWTEEIASEPREGSLPKDVSKEILRRIENNEFQQSMRAAFGRAR